MIITSPGALTPIDADSTGASMVPAHTGIPSGRPVSSAPCLEILPASSHGSRIRGSSRPGATSSHHSFTHSRLRGSNIGMQKEAEIESSVYSPVRRSTMKELHISSCWVFSHTSGSLRCSHMSFGPIDWWEMAERERSTISSNP